MKITCDEHFKQCCANIGNNTRCPNKAMDENKYHCTDHFPKALLLYNNYKKICETTYKMDVSKEQDYQNLTDKINYLNNYYKWLIRAYKARYLHREYAFTVECSDEGHNLQFEILTNRLIECEQKLQEINKLLVDEKLNTTIIVTTKQEKKSKDKGQQSCETNIFNSLKIKEGKDLEEDFESKVDDTTSLVNKQMKKVMTNLNKFKKQREKDERETNDLLQTYIKINEPNRLYKEKLVTLLLKSLKSYFIECNFYEDNIRLYISLYNIVIQLLNLGYFKGNFKPKRCTHPDCTCQNYVNYDITLVCNCKCYITYKNDMPGFFKNKSTEFLYIVYLVSLYDQNKIKILEIMEDLLYYYKIYGNKLFKINMEAEWKKNKQRLSLVEDESSTINVKESRIMAALRTHAPLEKLGIYPDSD